MSEGAAAAAANDDIAIAGLRVGDVVLAIGPQGLEAGAQPYTLRVGVADQMRIRLANPTAAPVVTAARTYVVVVLSGLPMSEFTFNPANVAADTAPTDDVANISGLRVGDVILAIPNTALLAGVGPVAQRIAAADTLPLRFVNPTAGGVNPANEAWVLVNLRGLPMSEITLDPDGGGGTAANTAPSVNVAVAGVRAGDVIIAVPPQALIADVGFVALRAAADDLLPFRGLNPTVAGVNAAAQVWTLVNLR